MPRAKSKDQKVDTGAIDMTQVMTGANPKVMEAWVELLNDSARFVTDRLQKDQETQQALLNCKTPADIMQVQSEFFKDAVEQYTAQTTRMCEKISEAAGTTLKETTAGLARSYDDVPL